MLQAAESTVKSLDAARRRALTPFETLEPFSALEPFIGGALEPFGDGREAGLPDHQGAGRRLLASSSSYRIRTRRMLLTQVNAATYGALSSRTVPSRSERVRE